MANVLVDTDLLIDHLRGAHELHARKHRLAYSVVTRSELFAGTTATDSVAQLLAPFREFNVDRGVAERAGRLRRDTGVRLPDAYIAATAARARFPTGYLESSGLQADSRTSCRVSALTRQDRGDLSPRWDGIEGHRGSRHPTSVLWPIIELHLSPEPQRLHRSC